MRTLSCVDFMAKAAANYSRAIAESLKKIAASAKWIEHRASAAEQTIPISAAASRAWRASAGTRVETGMQRTWKTMIQRERRSFVRNNCFERKKSVTRKGSERAGYA